jgi:hypothetical protein
MGSAVTRINSQVRKYREISKPDADLQLIAPTASRELIKSRFAKARNMNDQRNRAATLRVDFSFRQIRRSGSRVCWAAVTIGEHVQLPRTLQLLSPSLGRRVR